jgi:hypothetical protein
MRSSIIMLSDQRVTAALAALRSQISLFRFALSGTVERAKHILASESGPRQTEVTLGEFASGLIDSNRFAMVSSGNEPLDTVGRAIITRSIEVLESLMQMGDQAFVIDVPPEVAPSAAIHARLATLGSAFGAGTIVELVRRRIYDPTHHGLPNAGHPFEKWTTSERTLAPPLIVRVEGRDLEPAELAPFLDGAMRLVVLVNEPCAVAPLARLITPGVFVAQVSDLSILERLNDLLAPVIVAVMNGPEARFTHDPRAGASMWQRITVIDLPDTQIRKSLGNRSAWQQREDVAHLKSLVTPPSLTPKSGDAFVTERGGGPADPAERLTAWLLEQASLAGVS